MFEKQTKKETSKKYATSSLPRSCPAYSWTLKLEAEGPTKRRRNSTGLQAVSFRKAVLFIKLNVCTYKEIFLKYLRLQTCFNN
jgi:hypothetical protein